MEKLRFSVDEQKYNDRHGHVLRLEGWYFPSSKTECKFELFADGHQKIEIPKVQFHPRPDVEQALEEAAGDFLPGFTVCIPDALQLSRKYQELELFVIDGKEKASIWEKTSDELEDFMKESLVEFHLDRVEVLYDTMLEIQGWAIDQRGTVEIAVHKEDMSILECRISRGRRPDVAERRGLDEEYRTQEIGFRISANIQEIPGKRIVLHFRGDSVTKTCEIDVQELRKANRPKGFFSRLFGKNEPESTGGYEAWLKKHQADRKTLRKQKHADFAEKPQISIVIPLYQTPLPYLKELVDSVRAQSYENWQLCLADGSPNDKAKEFLEKHYGKEKRLVYTKLSENGGISVNTNAAIALAEGEFLMLCDHDDTLEPDALYEIVRAINEKSGTDVLYTDEDKVSMDGRHYFDPNFKPDFNLFRLRENNYICHIFVVRKSLADKVGYLKQEFDGAQDYDFIFRCCEQAANIVHIPKVLYHWRCHMDSTAADPASKMYAYEAGRNAIREHYQRLGIEAKVEMTERSGWYRSYVKVQGTPLVSVIIPNKDHIEDLELCLFSMNKKSTYRNYEVLVVENNSENPETFEYYKKLPGRYPKVKVLTWEKEFNYSSINNFAAKEAQGEYLLFLNNDVEILTPQWIEEMLQICQQDQVAAVGAKLYYPDDTIQHAGVVLGLGGIAGHIMCRASREETGYFGRMISVQEISAVTAACMMVRKTDFEAVGCFDETFQVAFNDIDLCMKLRAAGKKIVFTPYAELYHYESKSRGLEDTPEKQFRFDKEVTRFKEKWAAQLEAGDPYYSPNLSVTEGDCSLRED
ncbi:glycosyltransferase family 2 protein [Blautia sp. MSJ-19]|uniref:glycosyltransferase family 2 protein n=1 Tax=Blautia sp. MSJ-19 TaxID=2841517 RepID=UPI001C0F07EF|nr:glycosyltransferase family 2 protein [Blautia sp. MSJ-19]MBU5481067.1 glycosyltransferase family 2 protein [Blautia sp. MSJ-19]